MQFDMLTARDDGHEWSVRNDNHRKVATVQGGRAADYARLFAAAPSLHDALQALLAAAKQEPYPSDELDHAMAEARRILNPKE